MADEPRAPRCFTTTGWCSALLDLVNDAIFVHDPDTGAILDVNRRAEEMYGATREELRTLGIAAFSLGEPPYTAVEALSYLHAAGRGVPQLFEWRARTRSGGLFWVEVNIKRVTVGDDEVVLVAVVRDISKRKQAENAAAAREAELRERDADLRIAQRIARVGSWSWTIGTEALEASEEVIRIYGRDPTLPIPASGSDEFRRHYTPEGWERRQAAFARALEDGKPWERDEQIIRPDGSVRWVHFRGEPERDARGRIVKLRGTVQDITEQKLAEEALRTADQRKTEFLAMLSHELRNPLAPIRNSIYLLRHSECGRHHGAARALGVIERQSEHLTRLVDDLLDLTRIASGKIELKRIDVDLREVVSRAVEDFRTVFEERGTHLGTDIPGEPVWGNVDPVRMTQAIGNLLHNAAKFTPAGDRVEVTLRPLGGRAEVSVRDTGAGIDADVLPRVFDAFVQGKRTMSQTEGGLGLGLSLVKGIVELHGGSVRVESGGSGHGAKFTLTIPATQEAPRRAPAPRAADGPVRKRRVLVVDDNRDSAETLAEIVRTFGHGADVAFDGPTAMAKLREGRFDTVLCDIGLPGMSGCEVARMIRAENIPAELIAVSGYAQADDVQQAIDAGFDAHVPKPPDAARLERLLGSAVR